MMRLLILLATILFCLYSCNNDLKTIGQDLINNGNYIGEEEFTIESISTIKIDSFATSCGIKTDTYIDKLIMGNYKDNYTGRTTAIPCFQISPTSSPSVTPTAILDSVILHFSYGGNMWGDTLYNIKAQKFDLYQLKALPELDYQHNGYFYNNSPINLGKKIASARFLPKVENMQLAYFKLEHAIGLDLFERMKYPGGEDDIYKPTASGTIPYIGFLRYFKGLAIVPDAENNCLMSISTLSDSLYLRFDYHENDVAKSLKLAIGQREFQYNRIITEPSNRFATLTNQEKSVNLSTAHAALTQGLSGYMIKLILPQPPQFAPYHTIIKAEIELKPEIMEENAVAYPKQLPVYTTNVINEILGYMQNNSTTNVIGNFQQSTPNTQDARYIFDITEYYQRLSNNPPLLKAPEILLGIPNLTLSFDRVIVHQAPKVKVYYAKYK